MIEHVRMAYLPDDGQLPGSETFMHEHYVRMLNLASYWQLVNQRIILRIKLELVIQCQLRLNYYPFTDESKPIEIGEDGF